MDKPDPPKRWAETDSTYTAPGKGWDGDPNKVEPGTDLVDEGWEPGQILAAEHLNYLLNEHAEWLTWLDGTFDYGPLAGEVGDVYEHTFQGGPLPRTIWIPATALVPTYSANVPHWQSDVTGTVMNGGAAAQRQGTIDLNQWIPEDSKILFVRVLYLPGASRTTTNRPLVEIYQYTHSGTADPTQSLRDSTYGAASSTAQELIRVPAAGNLDEYMQKQADKSVWKLKITSGNDTNVDQLKGVELNFSMNGYRGI
jgi:hypothetical protein